MSTLGMDDRIAGVLCELWATGVRVVLEAKRLQASTEVGAYHTQDASKSNHPKGILSLVPCVYVCVCLSIADSLDTEEKAANQSFISLGNTLFFPAPSTTKLPFWVELYLVCCCSASRILMPVDGIARK